MCAPRVTWHISIRYSSSCHTRVNIGASIFFTAIDVCRVTRGAHIEHLNLLKKTLFQFSCCCEHFHWGSSFGVLVISVCNHGEHYEISRITSHSTFCTIDDADKRTTIRWTGQGPMVEKRNAKNGNQPIMLVLKSETLLLTRKIEQQNEEMYLNLLKPTAYVMHHQFNIQQPYALPILYLCVLYLTENKQRLVPLTEFR
jgi:hypothetical protein